MRVLPIATLGVLPLLATACHPSCGSYEMRNSGLELTPAGDDRSYPIDGTYYEKCGPNWDSWGWFDNGDVDVAVPDHLRINVQMSSRKGHAAIDGFHFWVLSLPIDRLRVGETLIAGEDLSGHTSWLDPQGNSVAYSPLTAGELTIESWEPDADPCGFQPYLHMDMSWDVEFGEVGSDDLWATARVSDTISAPWDYFCGRGWP